MKDEPERTGMPNARSPYKTAIVVYLPEDLKRELVARARYLGIPTTELQSRYLELAIQSEPAAARAVIRDRSKTRRR